MTEAQLIERWDHLCSKLPAIKGLNSYGKELIQRYNEEQRFYHGIKHLKYVLAKLDELKADLDLANISAEEKDYLFLSVELALWYHDSIYNPTKFDNEDQSAKLFLQHAKEANFSAQLTSDVERLILLTKNHTTVKTLDEEIMADCDLASLGETDEKFKASSQDIRHEYRHIPLEEFSQANKNILEKFLYAEPLFKTVAFRDKYEEQAKINLHKALKK